MILFENQEIRSRFINAFPKTYFNQRFEAIVFPARNSYFLTEDVKTELDLKSKVLEWLSREASKSISRISQRYHLEGINTFLETDFTQGEMSEIYTRLGNRCNHEKTIRFIESGYDMGVLNSG